MREYFFCPACKREIFLEFQTALEAARNIDPEDFLDDLYCPFCANDLVSPEKAVQPIVTRPAGLFPEEQVPVIGTAFFFNEKAGSIRLGVEL